MATSEMYNPEELQGFDRAKDITPSASVEEQLTAEEGARVMEVAEKMATHDNVADAVYEMENAQLNAEQQIYLWTMFNSKQRSAMKREQARMKAAAKAGPDFNTETNLHPDTVAERHDATIEVISPAAHKRLEARISELNLDREAVKKYVKDTFGRDHFTEMTKDEYEKLDKTIDIREAKAKLAQPATEEGP